MLQATKIPTLALAMDEPQICIQKHIDSRVEVATSNGLLLLVVRGSVPRSDLILQNLQTSALSHTDSATCMIPQLWGVAIPNKFEVSTAKLSQTKPFCSVLDS